MITFKNISTGELTKVHGIKMHGEVIVSGEQGGRPEGERFCKKWAHIITEQHDGENKQYFTVNEGWEVVKSTRKRSERKQSSKDTTKHEDAGDVKTKAPKARKQEQETKQETKQEKKYEHPAFRRLLALVKNDRGLGRSPWLFGPAGSGKSTLCEAVAKEMGLPFYSVSSLQQKYELEGYTDAAGEYVATTFYKAAKEGGIFLFDEAATTSAEVQIAFNSMLANLWYNFPKEGMVTAHPNFHVIAADNTCGRGNDSTYSARFSLDASTLDRYITLRIDYTDEHDLHMAHGDAELVTFLKGVRAAIEDTRTTYLASPRTSKTMKYMQENMAGEFTEQEMLYFSLCSGWKGEDIRTICTAAAQHVTSENKYMKLFQKIAKEAK